MKMETLKDLRHLLSKKGQDWLVSFDIQDGFYALGVAPEDRDYLAVQMQGRLFRFAALPMGMSASPYHFCTLMHEFVRHLRAPSLPQQMPRHLKQRTLLKLRRGRCASGVSLISYVDDFLLVAPSAKQAARVRDRVFRLMAELGIPLHPTKGSHQPTQKLDHLGLTIDIKAGQFLAPPAKLDKVSAMARELLHQAKRQKRFVPVKKLASLAGSCQFLYLAIAPARFYLRELHNVLATRDSWTGSVRITNQLRRDLQWWTSVPSEHNGRPIRRPVETGYLQTDASDYGWGAVLNQCSEARGFFSGRDRDQHITLKELQAVRFAVESFLPRLAGRRVVLDGDNQAVVHILSHLTSRSPALMNELRKLWFLLDSHDIHLRPRWISTTANVWADKLSREVDTGDWKLNPRVFGYLDRRWGPHTVDRFASTSNTQLSRFNSRWLTPGAEAVDSLRLPDAAWRAEVNWVNPPWALLPDVLTKLKSSGARATVVAPVWPGALWHQQLLGLAQEVLVYPPARDLFLPGQQGSHRPVGSAAWRTAAFRVPLRAPQPL